MLVLRHPLIKYQMEVDIHVSLFCQPSVSCFNDQATAPRFAVIQACEMSSNQQVAETITPSNTNAANTLYHHGVAVAPPPCAESPQCFDY